MVGVLGINRSRHRECLMLRAAGRTTFAVVCHDHNFKLGKYVVGEFDDGVDAADADDDRSSMPERILDCIRKAVSGACAVPM